MILLSILLLTTTGNLQAIEAQPQPAPVSEFTDRAQSLFHRMSEGLIYCGAAGALTTTSVLAKTAWGLLQITPWAHTVGNECLLLSDMCSIVARHAFAQMFEKIPLFHQHPFSHRSWLANQARLAQIPAQSVEQKQLLSFLERRWLAKATGLYSFMANWICPCFGIFIQMHPETTNSYARDPSNKFSETYTNRVEAWKQHLPQPLRFPLILTRPHDLHDYLPSYVKAEENSDATIEALALKMQAEKTPVVLDVTPLLQDKAPEEWLESWKNYRSFLTKACQERHLDSKQLFCIQTHKNEEIGGIRLLPLNEKTIDQQFLLGWVSKFGLSANRVELDRLSLDSPEQGAPSAPASLPSQEQLLADILFFDQNWSSKQPEKALMVKGALEVLKGFFAHLCAQKWEEILACPTHSSVVQLSFAKIKEEFQLLKEEKEDAPFYHTASHVEQIHAHLTALLEIFSPFTLEHFSTIYKDRLTCIPEELRDLTSCGIHASGMTTLAGILKAVEKTTSRTPRILYGENTYFETIHVIERITNATPVEKATQEDWKNADLLLVQFNPVLKRIDFDVTDYKVEKIAATIHQSLSARGDNPLTVALDCTLDYIHSPQVYDLLQEFQSEIKRGLLNFVCYRSGLKFDLFGLDNYCGAPVYAIHSNEAKWAAFDRLFTDPALQNDLLSTNWFCLAYAYAAPYLEQYRKLIFDNTRAFLDKVPSRLLHGKNTTYRIIPMQSGTNAAFVDIKVYGPLHTFKIGMIGGFLSIKCMEAKHPTFNRPSLGFYHPNYSILFGKTCSTIRLTLGLDPSQVDLLASCFTRIDTLNGSY